MALYCTTLDGLYKISPL